MEVIMYDQYTLSSLNKAASEAQAEWLGQQVETFLYPLVVCLDLVLDRRLVGTLVQSVIVMIILQTRTCL
jgi:hypothetical protein